MGDSSAPTKAMDLYVFGSTPYFFTGPGPTPDGALNRLGKLNTLLCSVRSCFKRFRKREMKMIMDRKDTAQDVLAALREALGEFLRLNYNLSFVP